MSAPEKFRACLAAWESRFSQRRAGLLRGAKRRSKTSVVNCWPTFGKELIMSRIGNKSIALPEKVKLNVSGDGAVQVEGPKGQLSWTLPGEIRCKVDGRNVSLARSNDTR